MNIQKAIGAGLLVFAIQFAAVNVVGNIMRPLLGTSTWAEYIWQGVMVLLLVGIVCRTAKWYFAGTKSANWLNGFYLGLIFIVTSFVINLLQAIPAVVAGQNVSGPILAYVQSGPFWITVGITLAASALSGYYNGRCTTCKAEDTA